MLIRRNTKAFKAILEIITACQDRADREKLIRLYITKAGHSIKDRISVEGIQGEASLFYEMNYQTVLNNLKSSNHQLHQSDDVPGIYFFHGASNKVWDETPFEFDEAVADEFTSLPEFPALRKKEKAEKFIFPTPAFKNESTPVKKEKAKVEKPVKMVNSGPKQPDFKLKHKIEFTDLEKFIVRPKLRKKDVLDYYHKIAEYILPYLKDRPQLIHIAIDGAQGSEYKNIEALVQARVEVPEWILTSSVSKSKEQILLCNDEEHLLFYCQIGCLEFNLNPARLKALDSPDFIVIGIDSPDVSLGQAIDVALIAKEILTGLQLPSFVKTDGKSGLHIYVPLDGKSKFSAGLQVAEYICKLIRLKVPDVVAINGSDDYSFGKVSLDYTSNSSAMRLVAPYSIVAGESALVATPLLWEEVKEGLRPEDFNHETIFKRLKQVGDPMQSLF